MSSSTSDNYIIGMLSLQDVIVHQSGVVHEAAGLSLVVLEQDQSILGEVFDDHDFDCDDHVLPTGLDLELALLSDPHA